MRALFIHQNFPGQFRHVARALHQQGWKVVAITAATNAQPDIVPTLRYHFQPKGIAETHPLGRGFATRAARGAAAAQAMLKLRADGFEPDIVLGHVGWGETFFVKNVWPSTKLVVHAEFYYDPLHGDAAFDPEFRRGEDPRTRFVVTVNNAPLLLSLVEADFGIAPTQWQRSRFPAELQSKIIVLHEGIDTLRVSPSAEASFTLPNGTVLTRGQEIVTFVNRNLEPYRGYHIFMRALPKILNARPEAQAVIVGGDGVSYGRPPERGTWKDIFLDEVRASLPIERVHFVGKLPYSSFVSLMQVSAAHIYLTYPFVLSWSMLEAMSAEALVIGSRTRPVEEIITDNYNGLLVDFFDAQELAAAAIDALVQPAKFTSIKKAARQTIVEKYDLHGRCLPEMMRLIESVAVGGGTHSQVRRAFESAAPVANVNMRQPASSANWQRKQ